MWAWPPHSLALFMRFISFSSLMASVMSPLIFSFPDMKAIVGFSFPETASHTLPWKQHHHRRAARRCGDGSPENILLKSSESISMTTSAVTGDWPCPVLPAPFFRSRNQTPPCSPDVGGNTLATHRPCHNEGETDEDSLPDRSN